MDKKKDITVLLYGLGAIGGAYAFFLSRNQKVSLHVIARSNYDVVKNSGMRIQSLNYGHNTFFADGVYKSPAEAAGTDFDYILCAQKASNQTASAEELRPLIKPGTTIVLAQNGVDNELPYRAKYPGNSIISCVVWIGAEQAEPGFFVTRNREATNMGLFPNPALDPSLEQKRLQTYASSLSDGGLKVSIDDNIQINKWEKLICNVFWNPVSATTRITMGPAIFETTQEMDPFARALMLDVIRVGKAAGVPLDDSLADKYLLLTKSVGEFEPSMLQDLRRGNAMEVDVIVGAPMRKARELGVDVPTLRAVYALITALDVKLHYSK